MQVSFFHFQLLDVATDYSKIESFIDGNRNSGSITGFIMSSRERILLQNCFETTYHLLQIDFGKDQFSQKKSIVKMPVIIYTPSPN